MYISVPIVATRFLSTLSLRRATLSIFFPVLGIVNFYPRSPCGERHEYGKIDVQSINISIHALLAESDGTVIVQTSPVPVISIHALLAESDQP